MATHNNVFRAIQGQIEAETAKAILLSIPNPDGSILKKEWFPISQLSSIHRTYDEIEGTFDVLMASEWILGQKGLLSIAGVAGVNPVSNHPTVPTTKVQATAPSYVDSPKQHRHNRLPYKDDEGDDIPF